MSEINKTEKVKKTSTLKNLSVESPVTKSISNTKIAAPENVSLPAAKIKKTHSKAVTKKNVVNVKKRTPASAPPTLKMDVALVNGAPTNATIKKEYTIWQEIPLLLKTNFADATKDILPKKAETSLWQHANNRNSLFFPSYFEDIKQRSSKDVLHELASLYAQRDGLKREVSTLKSKMLGSLSSFQARNNSTTEINFLTNHIREIEENLISHQNALKAVYASNSWKITKWIRDLINTLRWIKNGRVGSLTEINDKSNNLKLKPYTKLELKKAPDEKISIPEKLRIVAIGDGPIPSIYLSMNIPLTEIAKKHGAVFSLHYENDFPVDGIILNADIVFMKRVCSDVAVNAARKIKAANIPLIYMVDDDFSEVPIDTPLGRRYAEMRAWDNVIKLCDIADQTIVWSKSLFDKLKPHSRNIMRFNAFSNIEIFDTFKDVKASKRDNIVFGYAGGTSHSADLELVREPVLELLANNPEACFESIGLKIRWLEGHPQYKFIEGHSQLEEYYHILASRNWDFAIVPLVDSKFNAAKSDNKLREYSAAGVPAIYSRVIAYEDTVKDGVYGLLCDNNKNDWFSAIEKLYSDKELRKNIANNCKIIAREIYGRNAVIAQFEKLIEANTKSFNVLAVGPQVLPTFAIDIDAPFREMEAEGFAKTRLKEIAQVTDSDLVWADTLIIVREFLPNARDLMQRAHANGVRVIYSWDDNWFEHPVEDTPLSRELHDANNRQCLVDILTNCDLVKATTPPIYDVSLRYNANVVAYPYGFDFSLTGFEMPSFRRDGAIRIGYFGTPGRDNQFNIVIDALKKIQQLYDNIELEFLGFEPVRAAELKNVKVVPFMNNYEASIKMLASRQWDIGLAPLVDNKFNESKLPTKYRDYGAVGAAGIYSNIVSYSNVVQDYSTGIIVNDNVEAWSNAMSLLISNQDLRETIAISAWEHIRKELSVTQAKENWKIILRAVNGRLK